MNLARIADISKSEQTDKLKQKVYSLIQSFVYKYQTHYHPHYKGELVDLASDFYTNFTDDTKLHRNGERFSELDRFSHEKMGGQDWKEDDIKKLAQYVKTFVISRLIDRERQSIDTVSASEGYEEGKANINKKDITDIPDEPEASIDIASEQVLNEAIEKYKALPKEQRDLFINEFKSASAHGKLSEESKEFFRKVIASLTETPEVSLDLQEKFPDLVSTKNYKLGGSDAVKATFNSKDAAKQASTNDEFLATFPDYEFYTVNGSNVYLKKK